MTKAGHYKGQHFTAYVADVEALTRADRFAEAEHLLLHLVDATEAESCQQQSGVAPWYYEQLAIIYRKRKDYQSEVAILERFEKQRHAPGVKPALLAERLNKARRLAG